MKKLFLKSAALFFIFIHAEVWAKSCTVIVYPKCLIAKNSLLDTSTQWNKIILDLDTGKLNADGFGSFLAKVDRDYSNCFLEGASAFGTKIGDQQCDDAVSLDSNRNRMSKKIKFLSKKYQRDAYFKGLGHFFKPLDEIIDEDGYFVEGTARYVKSCLTDKTKFFYEEQLLDKKFIQTKLATIIPELDASCLQSLQNQYAKILYKIQLDQFQCKKNTQTCLEYQTAVMAVIVELQAIGVNVFYRAEKILGDGYEPKTWDQRNRILWETGYLVPLEDKNLKNLKVGEKRIIDSHFAAGAAYQLYRKSSEEYEAGLSLKFVSQKIPDFEKKWEKKVIERVEGCFARASKLLIGPRGEKLSLRLLPKIKSIYKEVDMQEEVKRESALKGSLETGCDVIVHEAFHILGLSDLYQEKWRYLLENGEEPKEEDSFDSEREKPKYDLRIPGHWSSLMYSAGDALDNAEEAMDNVPVKLPSCRCDVNKSSLNKCILLLANADLENSGCPSGSEKTEIQLDEAYGSYTESRGWFYLAKKGFWRAMVVEPLVYPSQILRVSEFPKAGLLFPNEFNLVVYPKRIEKNRTYYTCVHDLAYSTTFENFGTDRYPVDKRPECSLASRNWVIGNPPFIEKLLLREVGK